jgi:hypothetical protein
MARRAGYEERCEGTWIIRFPVSKAQAVVVRASTEKEHNRQNNQAGDSNEFDARKPEFSFTKNADCKDIQRQDDKEDLMIVSSVYVVTPEEL